MAGPRADRRVPLRGRGGDRVDRRDPRLGQLVEFVVELASGRLGARMAPSAAADEIDAVIMGLNMLGEELQALTGDLEERVAERTRELAAAREELEHLALYDPLTGLANRTLLADRLGQAMAQAARGAAAPAVLVLDLDGFKAVNDGFGHGVGDELLVAVADRLRGAVRDGDTVARLGGDEFAIVLADASPGQVLDVAARVQRATTGPVRIRDHSCWVGASIGVCFGVRGQSADTVLGDADTAMYEVKSRARGGVGVFEPGMRQEASSRTRLAEQLRVAVSGGQLTLLYQPIVELPTGRMVAVEALVRWQHPERDLLEPDAFIGVAEDTGLVAVLDRWVLDTALAQMTHWRATVLGDDAFAVHVNVSPVELRAPGFAEDILRCLARHQVPAPDLTVEITEHQMLGEDAGTLQTMETLRVAGVGLALDDFGTGSSSLGYVRRSCVDTIKIDRSLVHGLDVDAVQHKRTAAILGVIDAFDLVAVAEGVETAGEAARLRALGARYGQGHFWCPPRSADAVMDLWRHPWPP